MPTSEARAELADMVAEVFELMKIAFAARARARAGNPEELTETEFLALDALLHHESMTVGEIQKHVGVLPAQMSRVIRSLENRGKDALVVCAINTTDRRKVDVCITPKGRKAHATYQSIRTSFVSAILDDMAVDDRQSFMRMIRGMREGIVNRMAGQSMP